MFVVRAEKNLEKLANHPNRAENIFYLPPMNVERRQLVHELARQYGFLAETMGERDKKFVRLIRTAATHVPFVMLSKAAEIYKSDPEAIQPRTIEVNADSAGKVLFVVHDGKGTPVMLRGLLMQWEGQYVTNVLSDTEILIEFDSASLASAASLVIAQSHVFKVQALDLEQKESSDRPAPVENKQITLSDQVKAMDAKSKEVSESDGWDEVPKRGRKKQGSMTPTSEENDGIEDSWENSSD
jgi:hypothetical protein